MHEGGPVRSAPCCSTVVIVGAGQAGGRAAAALRQGGLQGRIVVIGDEAHAPYERPSLSKELLSGSAAHPVWVNPASFYSEQGIELRLLDAIRHIDTGSSRVTLQGGDVVAYDALVLATGARPRRLPRLEGTSVPLFYLRTLDDARALHTAAFAGRRVVIIGGGLIGLEAAASLAALGCAVTVVEAQDRLLARCLSASVAGFLADEHRVRGVTILLGRTITEFSERDGGIAAVLDDGTEIGTDVALVAVGVVPNTDLAESAGIAVRDGIVVDEHGKTSVPGVYAIGDATFQSWRGRRLESWASANAQASAAAAHILGAPRPASQPEWFWTDQFGINVQVLGTAEGDEVVRHAPGARGWTVFHLRGDTLLGATAVNDPRTISQLRRLLSGGNTVDRVTLGDMARPLPEAFASATARAA